MPGVTRVNPVEVATNFEQVGKDITWFNVTFAVDPSASTGPEGAIAAVYRQIQFMGIIIAAGPVSATNQSFGVEGIFDADSLAQVQIDIRALGTFDGIDLTGALVVGKDLVIA